MIKIHIKSNFISFSLTKTLMNHFFFFGTHAHTHTHTHIDMDTILSSTDKKKVIKTYRNSIFK